jgi:glycosyltransferase involved in cell wall biosynthesis
MKTYPKKRTLGVSTLGYPEIRNIASLPFERHDVKRVRNINMLPSHYYYKTQNRLHQYYLNAFRDFDLNGFDILHLFNGISMGKKPWVTTFETALPRWGSVPQSRVDQGFDLLAGGTCKALIALSQCAQEIQIAFIKEHRPDLLAPILEKMHVLYPPQRTVVAEDGFMRSSRGEYQLIFLGNQFFAKGGREVLESVERLRKSIPVHLTIISNLSTDQYASMTTAIDVVKIKSQLRANRDWISHLENIPSEDVYKLLASSDLALMPTYADTFGYFVLEAQAHGCPVITTDIRALPEINGPSSGWMISVPKDEFGNGILATRENRYDFSKIISEGLNFHLAEIFNNPEILYEKASNAVKNIKQNHCPVQASQFLENKIYLE